MGSVRLCRSLFGVRKGERVCAETDADVLSEVSLGVNVECSGGKSSLQKKVQRASCVTSRRLDPGKSPVDRGKLQEEKAICRDTRKNACPPSPQALR